jgi:hypothetical protein
MGGITIFDIRFLHVVFSGTLFRVLAGIVTGRTLPGNSYEAGLAIEERDRIAASTLVRISAGSGGRG